MREHNITLKHSPNILKGSLFGLIGFFFMAVFGVLTKTACDSGNFIWVSFITYLTATIITSFFVLPKGIVALKSQHYGYLIARATIGTLASFLYMFSMHYISVVNSTLLFNTAPIFIPIMAVLAFKVHEEKQIWYAVIIGFIGILFIIKPGEDILTNPGNLIGLLSGLALAIAYLCMKILTATDPGLRIIFYYFSIGTLMQVPLLFFASAYPSSHTLLYSALCGLILMLAQLALVKAYTYAAAAQIGVYQYTSVVFVALIEWLVASRVPELSDCFGFLLVSLAGIFIILSSPKTQKSN